MSRFLTINAARRVDPTRTTNIRASFVKQVRARWNRLKRDVAKTIVEQDAFGLQPGLIVFNEPAGGRAFNFPRSEDKVQAFMEWLERQEADGILEVIRRAGTRLSAEEAWSNVYIRSAYQRGITRARAELKKNGYTVAGVDSFPGGVSGMMGTGFHADRVGLIYSRTFEDLKTVAQATNARVRRALADGLTTELAQGIAEGRNPRQIARNILKNVNGAIDHIGKTRAEMIARTEVIRAHTAATIVEYRQAAGDIEVEVQAEVSTAGFNVCPICEGLAAGGPYTLAKAETLLPAHPNCRCALLPVIKAQEVEVRAEAEMRAAA